jgi:holo-[acyl-carrier protein] synthase
MSPRIVGIGLDLVELARLAEVLGRHPTRFVERICRPGEVRPRSAQALVQHVGGLFAAKEAVLKALGTGWGRGVGFRDVEIVRSDGASGPTVRLHDGALRRARDLGVERVHVSITHERGHAAAVAVLEG